jgi:hypothetical protein
MSQSAYRIDWNAVRWWCARKMRCHRMEVSDFMTSLPIASVEARLWLRRKALSSEPSALHRGKNNAKRVGAVCFPMHFSMNAIRRTIGECVAARTCVSAPGLIIECPRPSATERPCDIAGSEMPVAVSGMTTLRPKVSMCRCEGSACPDELSSIAVRLYNDRSMSCYSIGATALTSPEKGWTCTCNTVRLSARGTYGCISDHGFGAGDAAWHGS